MLPINTPRLLLRPLQPGDAEEVFAWRSDPTVARFQAWHPPTVEDVRRFIREQRGLVPGMPGIWYQLGIVLQEDGELIGDCGIHVALDAPLDAELGITLRPHAQHQGFANEVLVALMGYCLGTLHLHRVVARIFMENYSAVRLVERCGFTYRGRVISRLGEQGPSYDLVFTFDRRGHVSTANGTADPGPGGDGKR